MRGHFREDVLLPIDERGTLQARTKRRGNRDQRRVGFGDYDIAGFEESEERPAGGDIEGRVVNETADQSHASVARGRYAVDPHSVKILTRRQIGLGIDVQLT